MFLCFFISGGTMCVLEIFGCDLFCSMKKVYLGYCERLSWKLGVRVVGERRIEFARRCFGFVIFRIGEYSLVSWREHFKGGMLLKLVERVV
jgi:hypothetical protein